MSAASFIRSSTFLRRVFAADALVSGASALLMSAGSLPLSALLSLPRPLLLGAGLVLVPYALLVGLLAARSRVPRVLVWGVIAANVLWAVGCVALVFESALEPTLLGEGFLVLQALVVIAFAELDFIGLRRSAAEEDRTPYATA